MHQGDVRPRSRDAARGLPLRQARIVLRPVSAVMGAHGSGGRSNLCSLSQSEPHQRRACHDRRSGSAGASAARWAPRDGQIGNGPQVCQRQGLSLRDAQCSACVGDAPPPCHTGATMAANRAGATRAASRTGSTAHTGATTYAIRTARRCVRARRIDQSGGRIWETYVSCMTSV